MVALVPTEQVANLDHVLGIRHLSYRDAVLIQLAYALETPGLDTTLAHTGGRSVARTLAEFLRRNHIPAVAEAYQNIAKNTNQLCRGNVPQFDSFLRWASSATTEEHRACFNYACCRVAQKARPVKPLPELDVAGLSFAAVMALYVEMLSTPSEGSHEQYIVASLLDAVVQEHNPQYRVETKRLNAADASSRAAGDVQIMTGNRPLEAYEVTANDWQSKLSDITQKLRAHDLSRIHIVASQGAGDYAAVLSQLGSVPEDVSVMDLQPFCAAMLSVLTHPYRGVALRRLYEYLDRYGGDVGRVNSYVELLERKHLTVAVSSAE